MITHSFAPKDIEKCGRRCLQSITRTDMYRETGWCAPEGINVVVVLATEKSLEKKVREW